MFKLKDPTPPFAWSVLTEGFLKPGHYGVDFSHSMREVHDSLTYVPFVGNPDLRIFDLVGLRELLTVIYKSIYRRYDSEIVSRDDLEYAMRVYLCANVRAIKSPKMARNSLSLVASGPYRAEYTELLDVYSRSRGRFVHHAVTTVSLNYETRTGVMTVEDGPNDVPADLQILMHHRLLSQPHFRKAVTDIFLVQIE